MPLGKAPFHSVFVRHGMLCAVPETHRATVRQWLVKNYKASLDRYVHEESYATE
jgi:hypothetical protein